MTMSSGNYMNNKHNDLFIAWSAIVSTKAVFNWLFIDMCRKKLYQELFEYDTPVVCSSEPKNFEFTLGQDYYQVHLWKESFRQLVRALMAWNCNCFSF